MTTPLHRIRQKALAEQIAANAPADGYGAEPTTEHALLLTKLVADIRSLKDIKSLEKKAAAKKIMLQSYLPWCEGVLLADAGGQDEIITACLVWSLDAAEYELSLMLGAYCLKHGLQLPARYKRNVPAFLAEQLADAAKAARDGRKPFNLVYLQQVFSLTENVDMHDEIRAKLHKETGLLLEQTNKSEALWNLKRAHSLFEKIGVKGDMARIERAIEKEGKDKASS